MEAGSPHPSIESLIDASHAAEAALYQLGYWRGRLAALESSLEVMPGANIAWNPDETVETYFSAEVEGEDRRLKVLQQQIFTARKVVAELETRLEAQRDAHGRTLEGVLVGGRVVAPPRPGAFGLLVVGVEAVPTPAFDELGESELPLAQVE
ncbi:MAG: hypothetical protein R3B99_18495 [Polyangiales bacterium]